MDSVGTKNSGKKKTVISISIGSSKRDARGSLLLGDTEVSLERKGTDGDMEKAIWKRLPSCCISMMEK